MNDLFITTPVLEKTATLLMDKNSTLWVKAIITDFLTQYPELQNTPLSVRWIKKDTSKGFAVGTLQAIGGAIPVIIRDYQMSPLDMILFGNAAVPINKQTIAELMNQTGAFRGATATTPKGSLEIFGDSQIQSSPVNTPTQSNSGNESTRDAVKVASFIDRIENVDKDSVKAMFEKIAGNPHILDGFKQNKTERVLEKLAGKHLMSKEASMNEYLRGVDIDRQFVFKDDNGNYFVKSANSSIDYTWTMPIGAVDASNIDILINNKNFRKTAGKNIKITKRPEKGDTGYFAIKTGSKLEPLTEKFTIQRIEKPEYAEKTAFLMGTGNKFGLVVDSNNDWAYIAPEMVKKANFTTVLEESEPMMGEYGCFIVNNHVTRPFEVIGLVKNAEYAEIVGYNITDGKIKYIPLKVEFDGLKEHETEKNAYYVSKSSPYIALNNVITTGTKDLEKLANSTENTHLNFYVTEGLTQKKYTIVNDEYMNTVKGYISKNAEFVVDEHEPITYKNSINIVGKDTSGLFYLRGETFDKYAQLHNTQSLSKDDAIWASVHCGASLEDVEKIAKLDKQQEYAINNRLTLPVKLEKVANKVYKSYDSYLAKADIPVFDLLKEASMMSDPNTVDAVLSLGLMKRYNILEFLNLIPDYERVVGEMAKLLLMTRLGLARVPEEPVKTAMESMTQVIYMLYQLQRVYTQQQ